MGDYFIILDKNNNYIKTFNCAKCMLVENILLDAFLRDTFMNKLYPDFKYNRNEYMKKYNTGEISSEVASYVRNCVFNPDNKSDVVILDDTKTTNGCWY